MKKVTKYIALLIGGIALLSMAACSDDDGRTPSPAVDPNCIGASFVGDNIGYEELTPRSGIILPGEMLLMPIIISRMIHPLFGVKMVC